jgi:hypothetical protein
VPVKATTITTSIIFLRHPEEVDYGAKTYGKEEKLESEWILDVSFTKKGP